MLDPAFRKMTKEEQEFELAYKSDTYHTMDKMIENLKKFREDYCGNREPKFLKEQTLIKKLKKKQYKQHRAGAEATGISPAG